MALKILLSDIGQSSTPYFPGREGQIWPKLSLFIFISCQFLTRHPVPQPQNSLLLLPQKPIISCTSRPLKMPGPWPGSPFFPFSRPSSHGVNFSGQPGPSPRSAGLLSLPAPVRHTSHVHCCVTSCVHHPTQRPAT